MKNVLIISTTTHKKNSTSKIVLNLIENKISEKHKVKFIDANELHIVKNLSCYSDGMMNCASLKAGKYRCWAHKLSHDNPSEYGGKDEMGEVYEALLWCDVVVWGTSVRWGSHSSLMQKLIERMTNFENRKASLQEINPLEGKGVGVVVTGHNYESNSVANHLLSQFSWFGFKCDQGCSFTWQKSQDVHSEQIGNNNSEIVEYLLSQEGIQHISSFLDHLKL